MNTTNPITQIFNSAFADEDNQSFVEEVGTLVFQSALMRYYVLHEEDTANFDAFIESHVAQESFMEDLCAEYPDFESLLVSEMKAFAETVGVLAD